MSIIWVWRSFLSGSFLSYDGYAFTRSRDPVGFWGMFALFTLVCVCQLLTVGWLTIERIIT